jgi:hypothetical protein
MKSLRVSTICHIDYLGLQPQGSAQLDTDFASTHLDQHMQFKNVRVHSHSALQPQRI